MHESFAILDFKLNH